MRIQKKGKIVDIPVKAGTIAREREGSSGKVIAGKQVMVVGAVPPSPFSRAYGRQVYVCSIHGKKARQVYVSTRGVSSLYPVGTAKQVPKICRDALTAFKRAHPAISKVGKV